MKLVEICRERAGGGKNIFFLGNWGKNSAIEVRMRKEMELVMIREAAHSDYESRVDSYLKKLWRRYLWRHFPPFSLQSSLELMERCKFFCGSVDGVQCDILLKDAHTLRYFLLDIQQKKTWYCLVCLPWILIKRWYACLLENVLLLAGSEIQTYVH